MSIQRGVLVFLFACGSSRAPAPSSSSPAVVADASGDRDLDRKVTHDECVAAVDHAIALLAADASTARYAETMRETTASAVSQCEAIATLRDHECLMKSQTAEQLGLCPMPGQAGAR